jgi:hypothetical protein
MIATKRVKQIDEHGELAENVTNESGDDERNKVFSIVPYTLLYILTYGGVLWNGLRPFLFSCKISEWHPYGSCSNGAAAFFDSPSVDRFKSNPVDEGGFTPTYTKRSAGHRKAGACRVSKRRCLNENETTVIFFG